jgi:ATP-dependent 26S proteasome regulatory subunit
MCRHSIITSIVKDITDLIQNLSRKSQMHSENFLQTGERGDRNKNRKEKMNDKQQFQKLQKQIERNRSVAYIESIIMTMKQQKQVIKKKPDKVKMFLILVDSRKASTSISKNLVACLLTSPRQT